jgi:trans-2,3-dihydro-3-hydroxyanthranilate isomerase
LPALPFYIVDVFAESKYAGNQLAVFPHAAGLSKERMQKIAREMNFSETTFIFSVSDRNGGYNVRIFTPRNELPFAGHPTLGTAYVILREIIRRPKRQIVLNEKVGPIPVIAVYGKRDIDVLWMKQNQPTFGKAFSPAKVAAALSVKVDDIDQRNPLQEVSTGLCAIIVPLKSRDAVRRCRIDERAYFDLVSKAKGKGILVFCQEPANPENDLHARFFGDLLGVPEDPATGSANGDLAAYLVKYSGKSRINLRVEQGYEIGRKSLLLLKARKTAEGIDVTVGGKVVLIAKGEFV